MVIDRVPGCTKARPGRRAIIKARAPSSSQCKGEATHLIVFSAPRFLAEPINRKKLGWGRQWELNRGFASGGWRTGRPYTPISELTFCKLPRYPTLFCLAQRVLASRSDGRNANNPTTTGKGVRVNCSALRRAKTKLTGAHRGGAKMARCERSPPSTSPLHHLR